MTGQILVGVGAARGGLRGEARGESRGDIRGDWVFAPLWAFPLVGDGGTAHFGTATSLYSFRPPQAGLIRLLGLSNFLEVPGWFDQVMAWRVHVLVALVVGLVAVRVVKVWLRSRALRGRTVAKVLLPSPKFDPSAEEVRRVAAVLSRIHRATRSPATRDAYAVRLLLRPDPSSGLVQLEVHGHERARSVLEMVSFDQTESKPVDPDVDSSAAISVPSPVPSSELDVDVAGFDDLAVDR